MGATLYPNIAKACFEIALDNDGINRERTEAQWRADYLAWIARNDSCPPEILAAVDAWLGTLSSEQLEVVAVGGDDEREALQILDRAPLWSWTDALLNAYFDEVC